MRRRARIAAAGDGKAMANTHERASLRTDVSVLYVDPRGPYPKLVADWWDAERDARNYAGPNPVVAVNTTWFAASVKVPED